ncbi:MAG: LCP family protein, partial [Nanoarchaeota archaeon]|nr:LCP family protein [Nanoarchaeota archaeon]
MIQQNNSQDTIKKRNRKLPKWLLVCIILLSVIIVVFGGAFAYFYFGKLGEVNYKNLEVADKDEEFIRRQGEIRNSGPTIDENEIKENINNEPTYSPAKLVPLNKIGTDVDNILFLGLDVRKEGSDNGRSDVMMIISIDYANKDIKITSILRDCYVEIPGHKKNRINAAYAFGGAALAINTVNL